MPPKRQAAGPRPKGSRRPANIAAADCSTSACTNASSVNVGGARMRTPAAFVSPVQAETGSAQISRTFDGDFEQRSPKEEDQQRHGEVCGVIETAESEAIRAVDETLAQEVGGLAEESGEKMMMMITKKKKKKKEKEKEKKKTKIVKVVKVVKKIVKRKVPKKSLALALASCSNQVLEESKALDKEECGDDERIGIDFNDSSKELETKGLDKEEEEEGNGERIGITECDRDSGPMREIGMGSTDLNMALESKGFEKEVVLGGDGERIGICEFDSISVPMQAFGINFSEGLENCDWSAGKIETLESANVGVGLSLEETVKIEKFDSGNEMLEEVANGELVGERNAESKGEVVALPLEEVVRVENFDSGNEMVVQVANGELDGERNNESKVEVVEVGGGDEEEGKEDVQKGGDDVEMGSGKIALSGELEALERRRRRKTEIFIGGLDKEAREEDIRKVFEDVGEVVEVRLVVNSKTGKNKGYGFVRYALAADAKKALEKHSNVEICGKQCSAAPVEGNDTIFLGNIDKKWKNEDVIKLMQEIGIKNIDKVSVKNDPNNVKRNRGFAFLELETSKDAQIAFKMLQKEFPGKLQNIKVDWAKPLSEPDEEEMQKVKSVYAEYLPPSWDEEKVRNHFKKFGEIENVVLARNLHSSRRKDFAFINFSTREAALACLESFNHGMFTEEGSKVNVKVSLAKPMPQSKSQKKVTEPISKEISKQKPKVVQRPVKLTEPRNKGISTSYVNNNNSNRTSVSSSSGNSDLEHRLAEGALLRQMQARLGTGLTSQDYSSNFLGRKRTFSTLGDDLYNSDPRGYTPMHMESSFSVGGPSHLEIPPGAGMASLSYYQRKDVDYGVGYRYASNSSTFQTEEDPYFRSGNGYCRY